MNQSEVKMAKMGYGLNGNSLILLDAVY